MSQHNGRTLALLVLAGACGGLLAVPAGAQSFVVTHVAGSGPGGPGTAVSGDSGDVEFSVMSSQL